MISVFSFFSIFLETYSSEDKLAVQVALVVVGRNPYWGRCLFLWYPAIYQRKSLERGAFFGEMHVHLLLKGWSGTMAPLLFCGVYIRLLEGLDGKFEADATL